MKCIDSDTKIAMLLHCQLGCDSQAFRPLSHDEYNLLVSRLVAGKLGLRSLFQDGEVNQEVLSFLENDAGCKLSARRIEGLLGRVTALKQTLEDWQCHGINVAGRRSLDYPGSFQRHLGRQKPVLFYYMGDQSLFDQPGVIVTGAKNDRKYRSVLQHLSAELALPVVSFFRDQEPNFVKAVLETRGRYVGAKIGDLAKVSLRPNERSAMAAGRFALCSTWEPGSNGRLSRDDERAVARHCRHGLAEYLIKFGMNPDGKEDLVAPGYVSTESVDGSGLVWGCPTALEDFTTIYDAFEAMSNGPWGNGDDGCYRAGRLAEVKKEMWEKVLGPRFKLVARDVAGRRERAICLGRCQDPRAFGRLVPLSDDPADEVRLEVANALGKIAHFVVATGAAVDLLLRFARDDDSLDVRVAALRALVHYEGRAYLKRDVLLRLASDEEVEISVREEAQRTVTRLDACQEQEIADLAAFEFQRQFNHELVCNEEQKSKYDIFVDLCRARLPPDSDSRYQRLRTTSYVMRDDADIDVYTVRVAGKHVGKFDWFYSQLFLSFKYEMTSRVDVVVWGCGCGLDLLALYDQARRQDNPDFWLVVNSVTLIDVSESALRRARRIAEVLFPSARGRIFTRQADLRDARQCRDIKLHESFPYVPRLHLLSNLLDLFDGVEAFARVVHDVSIRRVVEERDACTEYCNDIYFAFSPEYRNGKVSDNLSKFRSEWGACARPVSLPKEVPENFRCEAFSVCDFYEKSIYWAYLAGNQMLRQLVEMLSADEKEAWSKSLSWMEKLMTFRLDGRCLYERYQCACRVSLEGLNALVLFSPSVDRLRATIVLDRSQKAGNGLTALKVMRSYLLMQLDKGNPGAFRGLSKDLDGRVRASSRITQTLAYGPVLHEVSSEAWAYAKRECEKAEAAEAKLRKYFNVLNWDKESGLLPYNGEETDLAWSSPGDVDFVSAFLPDVSDTEPLPLPMGDQRGLVYGRKQLRKVRGGPGAGKTLTMLWHAVMAIERTGRPVLLMCKTHSLISKNLKRLAATYIRKHKNLRCYADEMVVFHTLDAYLCDILKTNDLCMMSSCGSCSARCPRGRAHVSQDALDAFCREEKLTIYRLLECARYVGSPPVLDGVAKDRICEFCKKRARAMLNDEKRFNFANLKLTPYAAVLIDETQILNMDDVKLVYQMTGAVSPWREFYIFFDEEQSGHKNTLVQEGGYRTVPAPDTGFGAPITLKTQFRVESVFLLDVFKKIQSQLVGYELIEMQHRPTKRRARQGVLSVGLPFEVKMFSGVISFQAVESEVKNFQENNGDRTCLVLFENAKILRDLAADAKKAGWVITHLNSRDRDKEKDLRNLFYERQGLVHLTSVDCAQGQTFKNVIVYRTRNCGQSNPGSIENVFTAITRASRALRIVDASPTHWLYDTLQEFNAH